MSKVWCGPVRTFVQVALLSIVGVLGFAWKAHAYAWMVRHGEMSCSSCHSDPSGGELLTRYWP